MDPDHPQASPKKAAPRPTTRPPALEAQRLAMASTRGAEAQLLLLYPGLHGDPYLRGNIVKACETGHHVRFRSGGWVYVFWYLKKGRRLAVSKRREPRRPNVKALAKAIASTYTCASWLCGVTFPRRGRQRYCSTACRTAQRRLVRRGEARSHHSHRGHRASRSVVDAVPIVEPPHRVVHMQAYTKGHTMITKNMYVAGYLLAKGHPVQVSLLTVPDGSVRFQFEFPPTAESDEAEYDRGAAVISATAYASALKTLKTTMFGKRPRS